MDSNNQGTPMETGKIMLVGGLNPSEKYEFVNWDDDIPNIWENKIDVPNHQPAIHIPFSSTPRKRSTKKPRDITSSALQRARPVVPRTRITSSA